MCVYKDGMGELRHSIIENKSMDLSLIPRIENYLDCMNAQKDIIYKQEQELRWLNEDCHILCHELSPKDFDSQGLNTITFNNLGKDFKISEIGEKWIELLDTIVINTPDLIKTILSEDEEVNSKNEYYIDKEYKVYIPADIKPGYVHAVKLFNIRKPLSFHTIVKWAGKYLDRVDICDKVETTEIVLQYKNEYRKVGAVLLYDDISWVLEDIEKSQTFNWLTELKICIQNGLTKEYCTQLSLNIYNHSISDIRSILVNLKGYENSTVEIDKVIDKVGGYISLSLYNDADIISAVKILKEPSKASNVKLLPDLAGISRDPVAALIYLLGGICVKAGTYTKSMDIINDIKSHLENITDQKLHQIYYNLLDGNIGKELAINSIRLLELNLFTQITLSSEDKRLCFGNKMKTGVKNMKDNARYLWEHGLT